MTQTQNRPGGTKPGATQEQAGETYSESTHAADTFRRRHRLASPRRRRRNCRAFDEWAVRYYGPDVAAAYGVTLTDRNPVPYAAGGMTLDFAARERAA